MDQCQFIFFASHLIVLICNMLSITRKAYIFAFFSDRNHAVFAEITATANNSKVLTRHKKYTGNNFCHCSKTNEPKSKRILFSTFPL